VFAGWPYGNDFWSYTWGYDHIGDYLSLIISGVTVIVICFSPGMRGVILIRLDGRGWIWDLFETYLLN